MRGKRINISLKLAVSVLRPFFVPGKCVIVKLKTKAEGEDKEKEQGRAVVSPRYTTCYFNYGKTMYRPEPVGPPVSVLFICLMFLRACAYAPVGDAKLSTSVWRSRSRGARDITQCTCVTEIA